MRYSLSGLVGFALTLLISIPIQHLIQMREARASSPGLPGKVPVLSGLAKAQMRSRAGINVNVAPLKSTSLDPNEPRIKFLPLYPPEAAEQGIEGYVTLSFTLNTQGGVTNLRIVESIPPTIFDRAAIDAVERWSFRPPLGAKKSGSIADGGEQKLRLNFNLKKAFAAENAGMPSL